MYIIEGTLTQALQYLPMVSADLYSSNWPVQYDRELPQLFEVDDMQRVLDNVGLGYLSVRHGWDTFTVWSRVLSTGEQQRLMIASALLSRASCIVMDESTSACDGLIEESIFKQLVAYDKQYLCVSHRPEIRCFHSHELNLSAVGKKRKKRISKKKS